MQRQFSRNKELKEKQKISISKMKKKIKATLSVDKFNDECKT